MISFISVVICTYNRAELLSGCIDSLCGQTIDKTCYEVIVVDNNSTDNTPLIVKEFSKYNNIHYVLEKNHGLSYARNRGLQHAKGTYVAFIDDDARAAQNWLEVALTIINKDKCRPDCFGGPCHPFYLSGKPGWFKDKYESRGFGDSAKYLTRREKISGSNMVWERKCLIDLGMFDVNLGVVKNELKLGEETAAIEKLWEIKGEPRLFYSPDLIIYHLVPDYKMTVAYRLKRKFAQGQYNAYMGDTKKGVALVGNIFRSLLLLAKLLARFLMKIFSHSHWQNWLVEDGGMVAESIGRFLGFLGIRPTVQNYSYLER